MTNTTRVESTEFLRAVKERNRYRTRFREQEMAMHALWLKLEQAEHSIAVCKKEITKYIEASTEVNDG